MYKVTHAFDSSVVYYVGTENECIHWMVMHLNEHPLQALVPMKVLVSGNRVIFPEMTPEEANALHRSKYIRKVDKMSNKGLISELATLIANNNDDAHWKLSVVNAEMLRRMS